MERMQQCGVSFPALEQKSSVGRATWLAQRPASLPALDKALELKPQASWAAPETDGRFADDGRFRPKVQAQASGQ